MQQTSRGRLIDPSFAPSEGERVEPLVRQSGLLIEQILSGATAEPVEFNQDHDEWFVLLHGEADLEIDGERVALQAGDWMLLPRETPHRLLHTSPGTTWLAVRWPLPHAPR